MIKTAKPGRNGTVRVTFALPRDTPPGAVSVVGDFNSWDPFAHPLRRRANGTRSATVTVAAGRTLHFRYLAEGGIWFDDEAVARACWLVPCATPATVVHRAERAVVGSGFVGRGPRSDGRRVERCRRAAAAPC